MNWQFQRSGSQVGANGVYQAPVIASTARAWNWLNISILHLRNECRTMLITVNKMARNSKNTLINSRRNLSTGFDQSYEQWWPIFVIYASKRALRLCEYIKYHNVNPNALCGFFIRWCEWCHTLPVKNYSAQKRFE